MAQPEQGQIHPPDVRRAHRLCACSLINKEVLHAKRTNAEGRLHAGTVVAHKLCLAILDDQFRPGVKLSEQWVGEVGRVSRNTGTPRRRQVWPRSTKSSTHW